MENDQLALSKRVPVGAGERMTIRTWRRFGKEVRARGDLLRKLENFPNSILVSGCQRSGGTMLAKSISNHPAIRDFSWSEDAELDGALLLSGYVDIVPDGRYCFQTTYLNEEYLAYVNGQKRFKLVWLLRNPKSVVYSMLHNWRRFALNELFRSCGASYLSEKERRKYDNWGLLNVRPIKRACLSYNAKTQQLASLLSQLSPDILLPIEYESLVQSKIEVLHELCDFADLEYDSSIGDSINARSMDKASRLSPEDRALIDRLCGESYENILSLVR